MRDDAQELLKKLDLLDQLSEEEATRLNVTRSAPSGTGRPNPSAAPGQSASASTAGAATRPQSAAAGTAQKQQPRQKPASPAGQTASRTAASTGQGAANSSAAATLSQAIIEAAETCHHATQAAQTATDHALQAAQLEQENLDEVKEALTGWRRTTQQAQQSVRQGRRTMGWMLALTLLASAGSLAASGWLYYQQKHHDEQLQADLIDLMQTQTHLLNQKLNARVDELANLIAMAAQNGTSVAPTATPVRIAGHEEHADTTSSAHSPSHTAHGTTAGPSSHRNASLPTHSAHAVTPTARPTSQVDLQPVLQELSTLKQALMQLRQQQQQMAETASHTASPAESGRIEALHTLLTRQQQQLKQVQTSLWKLRQQLEKQPRLKASTHTAAATDTRELRALRTTLRTLAQQLATLQKQHHKLEADMGRIQQQLKQLNQNRPYSYRAPPMEIE